MNRVLALTLGFAVLSGAPAAARTMQLDDVKAIVGLSDAVISPDGKNIAYVLSRPDYKADRTRRTLMLYDLASGTNRALTFERSGVSSPAWTRDSSRLAFIALDGSGKDASFQVFVLDMRGGDAVRATDAPRGVQQYAIRPDGEAIAYVTEDAPANAEALKRHVRAFVVGDESYLDQNAPAPNHIWIAVRRGERWEPKRLTSGTWSLPGALPPSAPASPISWSPDGRTIVFAKAATPYHGDEDTSTIQTVDVASGTIHALTGRTKFESQAAYSPDGTKIAYFYPHNGDLNSITDVYVTGASGPGTEISSAATDANVLRAMWMPDSHSLLLAAHTGTQTALWVKPADASAGRRLDLHGVYPSAPFWLDASISNGGALAFAGRTETRPNELYYMSSLDAVPRALTSYNDAAAALDQGKAQAVTWQTDGFTEDGVVTFPPGYDPSKSYPLVLNIHGGPTSASLTSFDTLNQLLAAHGYIVFNPNYRGSDNLGSKYLAAIYNDSGAGPGRDVMAGIAAVRKIANVDASRIAISGWSYGGYMTSWLEGHYHVWKSAVAGAAVNNLVDAYNLSDNNVLRRYRFHSSPWAGDAMKDYVAQSPLTYAWAITTPTLILSDTGDARVPITQSYEMFRTLRDRGTPVRFFAYPVAGHSPSDPVRSLDVYRRWIGWIVEHFK